MKKKKYLDFYMECMNNRKVMKYEGCLGGLCNTSIKGKLLNMFIPTEADKLELGTLSKSYWGSGLSYSAYFTGNRWEQEFTPLRQTIVLFLACMNNEL